jgi:hypothetical protein
VLHFSAAVADILQGYLIALDVTQALAVERASTPSIWTKATMTIGIQAQSSATLPQ